MTIRELGEAFSSFFTNLGNWFYDLFCKIGFSSSMSRCYYVDWRDLTLGQAVLLIFLIYAVIGGLFEKAKEIGSNGVIAFLVSAIFLPLAIWIEVTLADNPHVNVMSHIPWFPFGLILAFFLLILPFILTAFVYSSLVIFLEKTNPRK